MPICGSNDVLVGDGIDGSVGVEPLTSVSGANVGMVKGGGVSEGNNLSRYPSVNAIAVLVRLAFCTSASLAGPPEAFQSANNKTIKRPVTPSACR